MKNKFSTLRISLKNIGHRKFRAMCLIGIIGFLSFVLIGGSLLSACLKNGIASISARLGADAMFVPYGYEQNVEGVLLRGEPSAFYFDGETAQALLAIPNILKATPQLFIASFDSPHCSAQIQMIGYDAETDFLIAPWLNGEIIDGPGMNEVVVGSKINGKVGDKLMFFSRNYTVVGKLAPTGMGFDTSAFINMDMAHIALKEYVKLGGKEVPQGDGIISSVAIKVSPDVDLDIFAKNIRLNYRDLRVSVLLPKDMISGIASNLNGLLKIITVLAVFLWGLAVVLLILIFALSLNERKREFGIFRALGSSKVKLAAIIITESVIISTIGAAIGIALLSLVYFSFEPLLSSSIDLPYVRPSNVTFAALFMGGFLLALVTGPVASLYSALRIGKIATAAIIKEGV
jgi:putative ABC transport system permease protein